MALQGFEPGTAFTTMRFYRNRSADHKAFVPPPRPVIARQLHRLGSQSRFLSAIQTYTYTRCACDLSATSTGIAHGDGDVIIVQPRDRHSCNPSGFPTAAGVAAQSIGRGIMSTDIPRRVRPAFQPDASQTPKSDQPRGERHHPPGYLPFSMIA